MNKFELKILSNLIAAENLKPKTPGSAGIDLMAVTFPSISSNNDGFVDINPGEVILIGTGIAIHLANPGYAGMILPRSGLGHKGLVLGNLVGLIDSDYQGELKVSAWNRTNEAIKINRMDRIAQLVIVPVMVPEFTIVDSFGESARGAGGFGSTGL
ncbi:dUTP diphosphatase [Nitrosomonas sp.]|uniref:dUTP diphosphatase n=1 Tax=Nitrosomonas sp. TaxID=42353 RepID=UPI0025CC52FA|nr:dUTP diphosphatase [Nitrosomonas sp.]